MTAGNVSVLLIVLAFVDWVFTVVLIVGARASRNVALSERASAAVLASIGASCAATLAAFYLAGIDLLPGLSLGLIAVALIALSVPQIIWGVLYLGDKFRG